MATLHRPSNVDHSDVLIRILKGSYKKGKIPELWDGGTAERIVSILREKLREHAL